MKASDALNALSAIATDFAPGAKVTDLATASVASLVLVVLPAEPPARGGLAVLSAVRGTVLTWLPDGCTVSSAVWALDAAAARLRAGEFACHEIQRAAELEARGIAPQGKFAAELAEVHALPGRIAAQREARRAGLLAVAELLSSVPAILPQLPARASRLGRDAAELSAACAATSTPAATPASQGSYARVARVLRAYTGPTLPNDCYTGAGLPSRAAEIWENSRERSVQTDARDWELQQQNTHTLALCPWLRLLPSGCWPYALHAGHEPAVSRALGLVGLIRAVRRGLPGALERLARCAPQLATLAGFSRDGTAHREGFGGVRAAQAEAERWAILAAGKLSHAQRALVRRIAAERYATLQARRTSPAPTAGDPLATRKPGASHLVAELQRRKAERAEMIRAGVEAAFAPYLSQTSLRSAGSSWVDRSGTEDSVRLTDNAGRADCWSQPEKVWHSKFGKRRWPGTSVTRTWVLRHDYEGRVVSRGLGIVDGVLTLDAEPLTAGVPAGVEAWNATWAMPSRGAGVRSERGVIVRRAGATAHGSTLRGALSILGRRGTVPAGRTPEQAAEARKRREERVLALALTSEAETRIEIEDVVGRSVCEPGARAWAQRWIYADHVKRGWTTAATIALAVRGGATQREAACIALARGIAKSRRRAAA